MNTADAVPNVAHVAIVTADLVNESATLVRECALTRPDLRLWCGTDDAEKLKVDRFDALVDVLSPCDSTEHLPATEGALAD